MNALELVNNQTKNYKQQHYEEVTRPEYEMHFGALYYFCRNTCSKPVEETNT